MNIYGVTDLSGDESHRQRSIFIAHLRRSYTKFNPKIKSILLIRRGTKNYGFSSLYDLNYFIYNKTKVLVYVRERKTKSYNRDEKEIVFISNSNKLGSNSTGAVYVCGMFIPSFIASTGGKMFKDKFKKMRVKLG